MTLAEQQAALVSALVAGGPVPPGFDHRRVAAAREALLHKRTGEVARHWPLLLHGAAERVAFLDWARGRPKTTSAADGRAFAEHLAAAGLLPPLAQRELHAAQQKPGRRWRRRTLGAVRG